MGRRFVSIWFRHLTTDWFSLRQPQLRDVPFVLRMSNHGRMVIAGANAVAIRKGLKVGMVLADARALVPDLEVHDDKPDLVERLLRKLGEWCIRFTPIVSVDAPDGLILEATGCTHLWGGDEAYIRAIHKKLTERKYDVRVAIADTAAVAWAVARYGAAKMVIDPGDHVRTLMGLPPEALRLGDAAVARLHNLGLHKIGQFIHMPRTSLRRRFGPEFLVRLDQATGAQIESLEPVMLPAEYEERLPCLEPIVTAVGIEIALDELLKKLCFRLRQSQKGLRKAVLRGFRVDGKVESIEIATNRPTHHVQHIAKLFGLKIQTIEPALGIELFLLEAARVEDFEPQQEKMWEGSGGLDDERLYELLDRLTGRISASSIRRYVPDQHYWPERSLKKATTIYESLTEEWKDDRPRPMQLLQVPERIEVTAPIPDYPPMLFRYKGKLHKISKADGPERIEQEWWLEQGEHRDYYYVEDEDGQRYWLFRLGHYNESVHQWFIHGFFA